MNANMIESVEIAALTSAGPDTEWSADVAGAVTTTTLVRVQLSSGASGCGATATYSMGSPDLSVSAAAVPLARQLIGRENPAPDLVVALGRQLPQMPLLPAVSALELSLWDLLGQRAGLPVYALQGAQPRALKAYASLPFLGELDRYIEELHALKEAGFRAVKLHTWCSLKEDLALVEHVEAHGPGGLELMLDVEQAYDLAGARRLGQALDDAGYHWFEAPLPDAQLDAYAELRSSILTPVLCSGNHLVAPADINLGIAKRAWDSARFDVTLAGGFLAARRLAELSAAAGLGIELQSWGHSLIQAANLHAGIASKGMEYLEMAVPLNLYEKGVLNPFAPGDDGMVAAPTEPGWGVNVDWDQILASAAHHEVIR